MNYLGTVRDVLLNQILVGGIDMRPHPHQLVELLSSEVIEMVSELVQPAMEAGEGYRIPSFWSSLEREFEPTSFVGLKEFEAGDAAEIN
jgi:hypothetical protein